MVSLIVNNIVDCALPQCCASVEQCLPLKQDCNQYFHILKPCDELHNCNLCEGMKKFFLPFIDGDFIDLQIRLEDCINTPKTYTTTIIALIGEIQVPVPCLMVGGWEDANGGPSFLCAELWGFDANGDAYQVSTTIEDFAAEWVVGFDANGVPYQTIKIDTSKIEENCFYIKVIHKCGEEKTEYCSEQFRRMPKDNGTLCITSTGGNCDGNHFGGSDCWNGTNNLEYNPQIRLFGDIEMIDAPIVREFNDNGKLSSTKTTKTFTLRIYQVPEFVVKHLCMILGAQYLEVNGEQYEIQTHTMNKNTKYFNPIITLIQECSDNDDNCLT